MTSSLSNRYYLGFSVGALMAQSSKFSFGTTRYQLNLIPELQVVWRSVVNSINGVSHLVMPIRRPVCLKRHGAAWLWTTEGLSIPVSKTGSLSFHSAHEFVGITFWI